MTLLVVFAGLPGSGKSVLSRGVADALGATYLRIDSIESAIVATLTPFKDNPVGYVIAERVAADQLVGGRGRPSCPVGSRWTTSATRPATWRASSPN